MNIQTFVVLLIAAAALFGGFKTIEWAREPALIASASQQWAMDCHERRRIPVFTNAWIPRCLTQEEFQRLFRKPLSR